MIELYLEGFTRDSLNLKFLGSEDEILLAQMKVQARERLLIAVEELRRAPADEPIERSDTLLAVELDGRLDHPFTLPNRVI